MEFFKILMMGSYINGMDLMNFSQQVLEKNKTKIDLLGSRFEGN